MDGKHRCHEGAGPQGVGGPGRSPDPFAGMKARHPPQHHKQQQRIRGVEEHIGQVMVAGVQAPELTVQHVGEPGQRMPIG